MEIVVKGRNVEVPDHYRQHVAEKLDKAVRLDPKIIRVDVELLHERNPRQSDHCQRVEITCISRGPVVRAEASAHDFYTALDTALARFMERLRRAADRRRDRRRRAASLAETSAAAVAQQPAPVEPEEPVYAGTEVEEQPWRIVREKEHPGDPMTVEDALFQMELVGHDFYLFMDKESGRPSVVYRRKGYDYGLISLGPASTAG